MPVLRFSTTINCASCVRAITPVLDQQVGPQHWQVDTASPAKTLTVDSTLANSAAIIAAVTDAGFRIQPA